MSEMKIKHYFRLFLAIVTCIIFVDCTKAGPNGSDEPATTFKKGQRLTLTVSAGDEQTKVTSTLEADGKISFVWQAGDEIKVSVGGESARFTTTEGGANAKFEGELPASGDSFDIQYPYDGVTSLESQDYSDDEALPHDKMLLTVTGCTATSCKLSAANAALRLNLYGTKTVGKITVTTETPSKTYTLDCGTGVTLGTTKSSATPFFIVMPACTTRVNIVVYDDASPTKTEICSYTTSAAQTFTVGTIKNMPAKEVKKIDTEAFSVSKDKQVKFTKGNLYWNGSAFKLEESQMAYPTSWSTSHVGHFFWSKTAAKSYAANLNDSPYDTSDMFFCGVSTPIYLSIDGVSKKCYALSIDEWCYLLNYDRSTSAQKTDGNIRQGKFKYGVTVNGVSPCLVIAPDGFDTSKWKTGSPITYTLDELNSDGLVCLPPTRNRTGININNKTTNGFYWFSTPHEDDAEFAYALSFISDGVTLGLKGKRLIGCALRLVYNVQ